MQFMKKIKYQPDRLDCGHEFCYKWLNKIEDTKCPKCPICSEEYDSIKLYFIHCEKYSLEK